MVKEFTIDGKKITPRKGKFCAQAAHASMKVILDLMEWTKTSYGYGIVNESEAQYGGDLKLSERHISDSMKDWILGKFTKVCVSVNSEKELVDIYEKAKKAGLICSLITDAGLTEFNGVPTKTCCAIGPAWSDEIDEITGHLPLL